MSDRDRNFWGWGYADKFPDIDARRQLAQTIEAMLGFEDLEPRPAPALEEIDIPAPRIEPPEELADICSTERGDRASHTYGGSFPDVLRGFSGRFDAAPDIVAYPREEAHISALMDWCAGEDVALIPFGGGTSVVGGIEADVPTSFQGAVSLDMGHFDRVRQVDPVSRAALIEAGATGPRLEEQLAEHGLTLRHYPQSFEFSTLGGWIATRAGGHFATLYTHIDDLVASIRMVTPEGVMETPQLPASGAGPDPNRLMLGSEGILGVITEAWMRVRPRPEWRAKASVHFEAFENGVAAVRKISQAGLYPAACRLLDSREAALNAVTTSGASVLILGFESADHAVAAPLRRALKICEEHGGEQHGDAAIISPEDAGEESSDEESSTWKQAFIEAPYLMNTLVSLGVVVDTFETACTWSRFEALHADIIRTVRDAMKEVCGGGRISCRFTHVYPDGPAPYYTFLAPGRRGEELEQWRAIKQAASETLLKHGATITHHHAVGRTHKPWYQRQTPELFTDSLRAAKTSLDPAGVLNPGVLLD